MSGHSKWSKVKHQKATTDVVKGLALTKAAHAITIAVKEGGGTDPASNFRLRLAIEKARAVNTPKENIERAIHRASGEGIHIEQMVYEGYAPGGVALLIEAVTDNKQRTVAQIKNVLDRSGGTLASVGSVQFLFARRGVLTVPKTHVTFDILMEAAIEAGADDVVITEDFFEVYTTDHALFSVKHILEDKHIPVDNAAIILHPTTTVAVSGDKKIEIESIVEKLEALDDVQTVYTNMEEKAL